MPLEKNHPVKKKLFTGANNNAIILLVINYMEV